MSELPAKRPRLPSDSQRPQDTAMDTKDGQTGGDMQDNVPMEATHDPSAAVSAPTASSSGTTRTGIEATNVLQIEADESQEDDSSDSDDDMMDPFAWLAEQRRAGVSPVAVLQQLGMAPPQGMDATDNKLWLLVRRILSRMTGFDDSPKTPIDSFSKVVELVRSSKRILVLTGAGISTSCGIPDFRSEDGLYARLKDDYPTLPSPESMFSMDWFLHSPGPFFAFAREIYPGNYRPSSSHRFIKALEDRGTLLRNYTQNIDTLENVCGITKVLQCHGSFSTASCIVCGYRVDGDAIRAQVFEKEIPLCPKCPPPAEPVQSIVSRASQEYDSYLMRRQALQLQLRTLASMAGEDSDSEPDHQHEASDEKEQPTTEQSAATKPNQNEGMGSVHAKSDGSEPGTVASTAAQSANEAADEDPSIRGPADDVTTGAVASSDELPTKAQLSRLCMDWAQLQAPADLRQLGVPILKPDIVFFGEDLPEDFYSTVPDDAGQADLLIVIGSSLQVQPVADIPGLLPSNVPQILINREPVRHRFNAELLGDCDAVLEELAAHLGLDLTSDPADAAKASSQLNVSATQLEETATKSAREDASQGSAPNLTSMSGPASSGDGGHMITGRLHHFEHRRPHRYLFRGALRDRVLRKEQIEGIAASGDEDSDFAP